MNEASRVAAEDWANDQQSPHKLTPEQLKGVQHAIASFESVGGVPVDEVEAWLDSLGTDHELPRPLPRKVY